MSDMNVALTIRFLTQGASKVRQEVSKLRGSIKGFREGLNSAVRQGLSTDNLDQALGRAEQRLQRARSGLLSAGATVAALVAPLKGMGDFEERLIGFGNTAGITGDALKTIETRLSARPQTLLPLPVSRRQQSRPWRQLQLQGGPSRWPLQRLQVRSFCSGNTGIASHRL